MRREEMGERKDKRVKERRGEYKHPEWGLGEARWDIMRHNELRLDTMRWDQTCVFAKKRRDGGRKRIRRQERQEEKCAEEGWGETRQKCGKEDMRREIIKREVKGEESRRDKKRWDEIWDGPGYEKRWEVIIGKVCWGGVWWDEKEWD